MKAARVPVEVVYARGGRPTVVRVEVAPGTPVAEVITGCGILARHPEIDLARQAVGIYGERVALDHPVGAHDRIEIYRPLIADPKEARRRRARAGGRGTPR